MSDDTRRPPGEDAPDREAILARRAFLLTSALAALSCSAPGEPGPNGKPTTETSAPPAAGSTAPTATPRGQAPAKLRPFTEVLAAAPPRGVPAAVDGLEKSALGATEAVIEERYGKLREAWDAIPSCDAADPACRPAWRKIGETMKQLFDMTRGRGFGSCGGPSGNTASVNGRREAHARFLAERLEELEAHLGAVAAAGSAQGEQEWLRVLANAKVVPPMPCLSPCAMPEVQELYQSVSFAKDDSAPSDARIVEGVATAFKGNRKASTVVVRGHASKDERDPGKLALARAQAVADALIKAGVPKASVQVKGFATDYPIARDDERGGEANRRVDFLAQPLP